MADTSQEYAYLFAMILDPDQQISFTGMPFVALAFFHALKIYLYRGQGVGFGARPVPDGIDASITSLMTTAYKAISVAPIQQLERLQWSLLIAAIETNNFIYRDWLRKTVSDVALQMLLTEIEKVKTSNGGTITMLEVRNLFTINSWTSDNRVVGD